MSPIAKQLVIIIIALALTSGAMVAWAMYQYQQLVTSPAW